jgi:tetratricopeptide (TPR) repeat protein
MASRGSAAPRETLEDRWRLEAQTARNLEALSAEQEGDTEAAIALYERNVAEGFPGDLPYGRLVLLYERRGALDEAERVLRRAIEVLEASRRRSAADRRATVRVFRNRLKLLLKQRAKAPRAPRTDRSTPP